MEIGIKGRQTVTVDGTNTARVMGSGTLDVFATPSMVALMEETAWKSVEGELEEGSGTVGISLEVTHDAPTPVGMSVTCESELVEIDGRKLSFKIKAYDEKGEIIRDGEQICLGADDKYVALCRKHYKEGKLAP